MANLAYRRESVARLLGSVLAPGASYTVTAYPAGAQVSGNQSGTTITVRAGHYIPYGGTDVVAIRPGSPATIVSGTFQLASSATATTVVFPSSVTVVDGDLIVPLGSDTGTTTPLWDGSAAEIYTDMAGGSSITSSRVTANASGEYEYWSLRRAVWEIVRDSSGTLQDIVPSVFLALHDRGVFDVIDFGGKAGDSSFNNTTAINAAITNAYDNGGGDVILPVGLVYVNGPIILKNGVRLIGSGNADRQGGINVGTTILCGASWSGTAVITDEGSGTNNRDIGMFNVKIDANSRASYGIHFINDYGADIDSVYVRETLLAGVYLQLTTGSAYNGRISGLVVANCVLNTSLSDYEGALTIEWTDCRVQDFDVATSSTDYSESGKRVGLLLRGGGSHMICNGFANISETGVVFDNSGSNQLSNVRADRIRGDGFLFTNEASTTSNQLTNCFALDCGQQTTATYYSYNVASSRNNVLIGCHARQTANTVVYAFLFGDSSAGVNTAIGCFADSAAYGTGLYSASTPGRLQWIGADGSGRIAIGDTDVRIGNKTDATVTLRFEYSTSSRNLQYDFANGRFAFDDDINVTGDIVGSAALRAGSADVNVSGNDNITTANRHLINLTNVSGTNTITLSAPSSVNGQKLILRCAALTAGTMSLADSGNVALSAAWTPDAADTLSLVANGVVWYETSRSAN